MFIQLAAWAALRNSPDWSRGAAETHQAGSCSPIIQLSRKRKGVSLACVFFFAKFNSFFPKPEYLRVCNTATAAGRVSERGRGDLWPCTVKSHQDFIPQVGQTGSFQHKSTAFWFFTESYLVSLHQLFVCILTNLKKIKEIPPSNQTPPYFKANNECFITARANLLIPKHSTVSWLEDLNCLHNKCWG